VFDLVIFDCDGVLVDSERIAVRIDTFVLSRLGWELSEAEIVERFVGRSEAYKVSQIEAQLGRPLEAGWDTDYVPLYREALAASSSPSTASPRPSTRSPRRRASRRAAPTRSWSSRSG